MLRNNKQIWKVGKIKTWQGSVQGKIDCQESVEIRTILFGTLQIIELDVGKQLSAITKI